MILRTSVLCLLVQLFLINGIHAADQNELPENDFPENKKSAPDYVFMHGGQERTYKLHVPENLAENPPLLLRSDRSSIEKPSPRHHDEAVPLPP